MTGPPPERDDGDMWEDAPIEQTRSAHRASDAKQHALQMADTLRRMRKVWAEVQQLIRGNT